MDYYVPDIPRLYTGIAEWLGCMTILSICPRRISNLRFALLSPAVLLLQCFFLIMTADAPYGFAWVFCMVVAILIMFAFIHFCADTSLIQSVYCTSAAFLFAEFAASLEWQLHTWFSFVTGIHMAGSVILLVLIYVLVFGLAFYSLKSHLTPECISRFTVKDAVSAMLIAVITFAFSNISSYLDNSPFSGQVMVDVFAIRTLIDINGVYANENEHLLQEILRDQWGFDGFVVSDWGAGNDFVKGVAAGSHLEMPTTGGDSAEQLIKAVKAGRIDESMVDRRVDELLDVVFAAAKAVEAYKGRTFDIEQHHAAAMKASEQSIVLLKNEDQILPLKEGAKVAVIGDFAETPRYQGAGSSVVNPTRLDSCLDVIGSFPLEVVGFEKGYPRVGAGDPGMPPARPCSQPGYAASPAMPPVRLCS